MLLLLSNPIYLSVMDGSHQTRHAYRQDDLKFSLYIIQTAARVEHRLHGQPIKAAIPR